MKRPIRKNRTFWNSSSATYQDRHGASLEATARAWGVWRIPESRVRALGEVAGRRVLELGCGAAQWSTDLAQDAARVVGLDLSEGQLAEARRRLPADRPAPSLVQAQAAELPFAAASFDVVFCDHGAMTFSEPAPTVAEVARVLAPEGRFVFCMSTPLRDVCVSPEGDLPTRTLEANYFELERLEDPREVCFQLPYGRWIRLFRRNGFAVEDLIELRPAADAKTTYGDYTSLDWARNWPSDHIWKLTKES